MKQKNFAVEMLIGAEDSVTFVVREFSEPNYPPVPVCVCSSPDELSQFFDDIKSE